MAEALDRERAAREEEAKAARDEIAACESEMEMAQRIRNMRVPCPDCGGERGPARPCGV